MTGMFSCILCMFVCLKCFHICFFLGSRMFVIYHKSEYSSVMFYNLKLWEIVHPGQVLMTGMFFLLEEHSHMFFPCQNPSERAAIHQNTPIVIILIFLLQTLCYSCSELPSDVEIYFWFFQKISTSIRDVEMMDAQVMFWMTFCSWRLPGNKQLSIKVVCESKITKVCFGGYHSDYWCY